ncbi:MAG: adenosylcobinamide-GDP ribazoletransferase [Bacillota bacterium]
MKGLIIALQFMTRIPLGGVKLNITEEEFGGSSRFFPVVGLIIGIILFLIAKISSVFMSPLVVGALIVVADIILTGGIHLEGFMDTMDGMLSARPKEKVLEIMKDSRVGAHSVVAVFSLLILKYSIIISLLNGNLIVGLLLMPVISRWVMLYGITFYPYAREKGLGKIFWENTTKNSWYILTGILLFTLALLDFRYLMAMAITYLVLLTPMIKTSDLLNGLTGDIYGAINEVSQVVFIFICLLLKI